VAISSYSKLLRSLRASRFAPCAALFYVDLHDLRSLNRYGHPGAADRLLAGIGDCVARWAGNGGIGLRLWSNEFVAAKAIDHPQSAIDEARSLREQLLSLRLPGLPPSWTLAVSIGVACAGAEADWEPLLRRAALACDAAKRRGINQIVPASGAVQQERDQLISAEYVDDFRRLLAAGELTLHPQPIIDIRDNGTRLIKAEFLIRMDKNGVVMPLPRGMIESLEQFGIVTDLDRFSSAFILSWLEDNAAAMQRLESVSINLSAKSVADGDFMYKLFSEVRGARLPHGTLGFEITETTAVEHLDVASDAISDFRAMGCRFSLDDFGSGLCSFGYLQSLPVDEVKIDGRFMRGIATEKPWREIVSAIHQVAHATGKKTTAEFVDDLHKLEVLRQIGVDYAQGYLFYPAVPPEKLLHLLGLGATP
jgi:EAL domain-containing protein (putative c-di-GMP-specific phosphodiesterase class I)/GGDEF domain-containing protein